MQPEFLVSFAVPQGFGLSAFPLLPAILPALFILFASTAIRFPSLLSLALGAAVSQQDGCSWDVSLMGRGARGSGAALGSWSWELKSSPTQKLLLLKSFALDVTFNLALKARQALETLPDTI